MPEDFTTLNNPRFLYLAELTRPFPDWVRSQEMPTAEEFEKKAAAAFADPNRRLLPIATKSAAFHSALNIFAHMEDYDEAVFDRVKEACAHFGIEEDVAPYAEIFAGEFEKSASADEAPEGRFAIDTELGGERFKLLPLNDGQDVVSSAFELAKMAAERRIHFLMLVPAAREIVKAASEFEIPQELPELVIRFGEERCPDAEKAAAFIAGREAYCKDEALKDVVKEDYQAALHDLEKDPDAAMEKIAVIDMTAGIEPNLRREALIPTPFDIVFSGPLQSEVEKAAAENVFLRDVLVPLEAVRQIDRTEASFKLSKEAGEQFALLHDVEDARDLSLAVGEWEEKDQRTFLRMAAEAAS